MCDACNPVAHYYVHERARVFVGINFGNLVKKSPIRQIKKIPTEVSGYTVVWLVF